MANMLIIQFASYGLVHDLQLLRVLHAWQFALYCEQSFQGLVICVHLSVGSTRLSHHSMLRLCAILQASQQLWTQMSLFTATAKECHLGK